MKKRTVKYLSCILVIVLAIASVTIFYVKASGILSNDKPTEETQKNEPTKAPTESNITISDSGTIISEYLTDSSLRLEWAALKNEGEDVLYFAAELYLDTPEQITVSSGGYLMVNDEKKEFEKFTKVGTSNLICSFSQAYEGNTKWELNIEAKMYTDINDENGIKASELLLKGTILASEDYTKIPSKHINNLEHVSQFPDLPSGDEVTSLAMVLSGLGYKVDKCDLCDLYLEKGPVGYTDFNVANIGNPRDAYNSYGCMPPVIINAANKFISANGGSFKAYNLSKKSISELYYEVSQGNNIIVWVCEDFDITPSISRIWIVDGKEIRLKSNMACMVLIGYDFEKGTVMLSDPASGIFEISMELFEYRYFEMGAYSVLIK